MKDNYDFSKGVKNPHADKLKKGYTVTIHYAFKDDSAQKKDIMPSGEIETMRIADEN